MEPSLYTEIYGVLEKCAHALRCRKNKWRFTKDGLSKTICEIVEPRSDHKYAIIAIYAISKREVRPILENRFDTRCVQQKCEF